MKVSVDWLQDYFEETLPSAEEIVRDLTFHAFEVERIEKIGDDTVLDVDVLPNRAHDCLSHRGIAKEIAAIRGLKLKKDPLSEARAEQPVSKALSIEIEDSLKCPRYSAAVITGVKVKASPDWLKRRLEALGQRSINNIVDATNYVMFDLGQPLHAFDAGKLHDANIRMGANDTNKDANHKKWSILVRGARGDEKIVTLDGTEHKPTPEDLLIVDGNSDAPVGIAGVKGGRQAWVDEATTDIVIESANFHPVSVRKTSQRLNLRTDASKRFENELSPELARYGLDAACELILELAEGELEGYADDYPRRRNPYVLGVSRAEANTLLGTDMSDGDIEQVLARLGFSRERVQPVERVVERARELVGAPYTYGASISYDAPATFDCSSFVAYLFAHAGAVIPRVAIDQYAYGEDVSETNLAVGDVVFARNEEPGAHSFVRIADGERVVHEGAKEETHDFMPGTRVPGGISHNGVYLGDGDVAHAHPERGVVVEKLAESAKFKHVVGYRRMITDDERFVIEVPFERLDIRRKEDVIEELGRLHGYEKITARPVAATGFKPQLDKTFAYAQRAKDELVRSGFSEISTYTFTKKGDIKVVAPLALDKAYLRTTLWRDMCEALRFNAHYQDLLALPRIALFEINKVFPGSGEHLSLALGVHDREKGAKPEERLDAAATALSQVLDVRLSDRETKRERGEGFVVSEYHLGELIETLPESNEMYIGERGEQTVRYQPISPYPFSARDIAVWVPEEVAADDLVRVIVGEAGDLLVNSRLFDEYRRDGRVSYAFRLAFQSREKTLTDEEVNEIMQGVAHKLAEKGWEVR